jgi:hypothetical protein
MLLLLSFKIFEVTDLFLGDSSLESGDSNDDSEIDSDPGANDNYLHGKFL